MAKTLVKDGRLKSDIIRFKAISKYVKGEEVLDIGSSEGNVHAMLVSQFPNKKFFTLDNSGKCDFKMDLDSPKKINKKFDTIIAGEIIEHLRSPISFIEFCQSTLKKSGRLILTTPNATGLQYFLNPSWCVFYEDYRGHTQTFTLPMLRRISQDAGLKVIHEEHLNAFWLRNPLQYLSALIPRLRPDLLIVLEKN